MGLSQRRPMHTSVGISCVEEHALGLTVWSRQARTPAILPHGSADETRISRSTVAQREKGRAARLAPRKPVSAPIEGERTPAQRRDLTDRVQQRHRRHQHGAHTAQQSIVALVCLESSQRRVARHQRGRAGRVEGDTRALQSEHERQPTSSKAVADAADTVHASW